MNTTSNSNAKKDDATGILLIDKFSSYLKSLTIFKNSSNNVQHHLYERMTSSPSTTTTTTKLQYYNQTSLNGAIQFGIIQQKKVLENFH